jgi:hypothetical protein
VPTLETIEGKPVDVTPVDAESINAKFQATMDGDGQAEQELPKRAARGPATDAAKPRVVPKPKPEKARTTGKAAPSALSHGQRVEGLKGIGQVVAGLALMGAKATGSAALAADAIAVVNTSEDGAEAFAALADTDPRFAGWVDKVCAAGPYSAIIAWGVGLGTQLWRNHKPSMQLPGTVHPDELLGATAAAAA